MKEKAAKRIPENCLQKLQEGSETFRNKGVIVDIDNKAH